MKRAEKRQALVDHYIDFYSLAMAMLRDEQDAQDAVQEGIVKTLVKLHVDNAVAYCRQAVRNAAIDIMRHRKRIKNLDGIDIAADTEHDELLRRVSDAKEDLPETTRALIELHDEEGYSFAKLAALTGLSVSSVRRYIEEAHIELKNKIKREI